ncbi:YbjQ family protein [Oceanicoccus sagamiensis]|uniref:Metal-binding protein n=1 Tax=Oceanicoccus sagamiensis TaxID=716816 RepID=A0A1X9NAC4_9GAMM|nr:heavy metal-binding domain-containing protein [Oceanicoccus sagamiensis]ARN74014.1 hypothetical protein BST96_07705 [Oceanicoccus sagamiensis]
MFDIVVFLSLITLGYIFGRIAETRHFKSIALREQQLRSILCFSERLPPPLSEPVETTLVAGNVVISVDYFKRIAASLRSLIGGRVTAYETLIERARREAILRMKQEASNLGATTVCNVKLETASITKGKKQQIGSVEVYAYGTALIPTQS